MNDERRIIILNLDDILPNRFQPRIKFDEQATMELADKYEIIAGERRYKASILAGKKQIPAIVTEFNDKDSAEVALIENVQRRDLTPIEEAISYKKILDMGYLTQEQLATKLGCTQSTIANKLRLLNLDDEVQEALLEGTISERHARSLLKLTRSSKQREMLHKIITERLTVRKTDEEIKNMINNGANEAVEEVPTVSDPSYEVDSQINNPIPEMEPQMDMNNNIENNHDFNTPNYFNNVDTNPSFMNIDKIENEAEDIYQDRPIANMDTLLKQENLNPLYTEPTIPEMNIPQHNIEPELEPDAETPESYLKPGKFFNIFEVETNEDNTMTDQQNNNGSVDENNIFNQSFDINQTEVEEVYTEPEEQPIDPYYDTPEEIPNREIEQSESQPATSPSEEIDVIDVETIEEEPVIIEEPIQQQPVQAPQVYNNSLKEVISAIRECSEKIEKLGYKIDAEEIDFEDMYQVILKVEK